MDRSWRAAVSMVVIAIALSPVPSRAQTPGGVEVQPTIQEPSAPTTGRVRHVITYINKDPVQRTLRLAVRETWNDQECCDPRFMRSKAIERAFTLDKTQLVLAPGERGQVRLTGSIPEGARSAYPAVTATMTDQRGTSVAVESRLASMYLLRGPTPWDERVSITDVGLLPSEGRNYRVFAVVKNIGNVHVRPSLSVQVRRTNGELLGTVALEKNAAGRPVAILPTCQGGCSVRLTGVWRAPTRIDEPLRLVAQAQNPSATATTTVGTAGSGGELGQPTATVAIVRAIPGDVTVRVTNTGDVALPELNLQMVVTQDGSVERAREHVPLPDLRAGRSRDVRWRKDLADGSYEVTATLFTRGVELATAQAELVIGAPASGPSRLPMIILAAVLLIAAIALWLFVLRRRAEDKVSPPPRPLTRTAAR